MPSFKAIIRKYNSNKEKTGWTFVDIPLDVIKKLKLTSRREFRIKGVMDEVKFSRMACYPVKDGTFIIALNAEFRKKLGKKEGAQVSIKFEVDKAEALKSKELLECLAEDPVAKKQFESQLLSHQNYFHRYVFSAKGAATRAGRIVNVIDAMYKKQNFGEMLRSLKGKS